MSSSQHRIQPGAPLKNVELNRPGGPGVSPSRLKEAQDESFSLGFEAGQKSMNEQVVTQRAELAVLQQGLLQSLRDALPRVIADCEQALLGLVLECSRRVVAEIPISAELVEAVVREALREIQAAREYTLVLHPEDLELLQRLRSTVLPPPEQDEVRLEPDPALGRGGCLIKTQFGVVDATRAAKEARLEGVLAC